MSKKGKGSEAERELIHLFWKNGLAAIRVAGSGSMKYPSPDIIVNNKGSIWAIECKSKNNGYIYLTKKEIQELKIFSGLFGAHGIIAVRFSRKEWSFLEIDDLKETNKNFVVDLSLAKEKGLNLDSFLKHKIYKPF